MSFKVPNNQPVSRTTYGIAVREAARLPESFIRQHSFRIDRGFEFGESVSMIVDELKMIHSITPTHRPTKSPRSYATRVVRVAS